MDSGRGVVHGAVAQAGGLGPRGHDQVAPDGAGGEVHAGGGRVAAYEGVLLLCGVKKGVVGIRGGEVGDEM